MRPPRCARLEAWPVDGAEKAAAAVSPGATFERVYLALKEQLGSGRFAPGDHLEPANLSVEMNSSITPVRDALYRLVGERLVEAPRSDGFRTPIVTEVALRHLYAWNLKLLSLAIRGQHVGGPLPQDLLEKTKDDTEAAEHSFLHFAGWSNNSEHVDAVARLNDRLRPIRRIEPEAVSQSGSELVEIVSAVRLRISGHCGEISPPTTAVASDGGNRRGAPANPLGKPLRSNNGKARDL